ncbi:hypothetical protein B0H16DRAFT_1617054, partial [Mycena metata]
DFVTSGLSRNSSSNVSWGTKIRGAVQVGHGLGEAIRGSLGAADVGPHAYTSSGQIADRGRHEIAQGLARMRGVTTSLPAAPVYDRRHSYPTRQYEEQSSVWSRRSSTRRPRALRFKILRHPYPVEPEPDSGFAGLEGNDRPMPAFVMEPPHPSAPPSQTAYPSHQSYSAPEISIFSHPPRHQRRPLAALLVLRSPAPKFRLLLAHITDPWGMLTSLRPSATCTSRILSTGPLPRTADRQPSPERQRLGRIQSMFLPSGTQTRPASPDGDLGTEHVEPERDPRAPVRKRSISAPTNPHQHESALEHAGYDVLTYNAKDVYPSWPTEEERRAQLQTSTSRGAGGPRLEPVRSVRA